MGPKRNKKQIAEEEYDEDIGHLLESSEISDIEPNMPTTMKKVKATAKAEKVDKEVDWPEEDLNELLNKMQSVIPEKDNLVFSTRAEKLAWEEVAFKNYSAQECKETWLLIQKRIRRFRVLSELLQDAREWITKPWTNFYRGSKAQRHPDMPSRPLSTYMIFYIKHKDKIVQENPGLEMTDVCKMTAQMYKNLPSDKKAKYERKAAKCKKEYEDKMKEFLERHPNYRNNNNKQNIDKTLATKSEANPKKPRTPFGLYLDSQLKKLGDNPDVDKSVFKEQCKDQWKKLSDKKKVCWINWAEEEQNRYEEEMKNFVSKHPDFVPSPVKSVLTKEEKSVKERVAGKPVKPPNSAYSLFSRMLLKGEDIKKISPKERMNYISKLWKDVSEKEKAEYRERAKNMMEQYKRDFATYLKSLPEERQQEELQNIQPKRKMKQETLTAVRKEAEECIESPPEGVRECIQPDGLQDNLPLLNIKQEQLTPPEQNQKEILNNPPVSIKQEDIPDNEKSDLSSSSVDYINRFLSNCIGAVINEAREERAAAEKKNNQKKITEPTQSTSVKSEKTLPVRKTQKKKRVAELEESGPVPKKQKTKKVDAPDSQDVHIALIKKKLETLQPKQPPISPIDYFIENYEGELSPKAAWSKLSPKEKKQYDRDLYKIKQEYIVAFEQFLRSLTKEELEIYSM